VGRPHERHAFTRVISRCVDGRVVYGCDHVTNWRGCIETEIRRENEASPFEAKHRQKVAAQRQRAARRGA
jgi:hypothetical protein